MFPSLIISAIIHLLVIETRTYDFNVLGKAKDKILLGETQPSPVDPNPQSKIRKVLISDWNKTSHAMDTDTALAYLTLTGQLSAAVENAEMFQIVALMSLFNGARAQSVAGELAKESAVHFHQWVSDYMYILLTLIWEFHHEACMP